jgi:hypothetical protein
MMGRSGASPFRYTTLLAISVLMFFPRVIAQLTDVPVCHCLIKPRVDAHGDLLRALSPLANGLPESS